LRNFLFFFKEVFVNVSERLKKVRGELSQQEFADQLGIKRSVIADLERGKTKKPSHLLLKEIERKFHINPEWMLHGTGEMYIRQTNHDNFSRDIAVPLYKGGAGGGVYNYDSRQFLLSLNPDMFPWVNAKNVVAIEVEGDSMEPALHNGDYIIVTPVDPSRRNEDGIYAIRIDETVKIKALQFKIDGTIKIISYNKSYEDEIYDPRQSQVDFEILGRMRLRVTR
jgi:transcriptional regulator with XRE-family HTH domain